MVNFSASDEFDGCTLKCSSGLHVSSEQVQHHLGQPEALVRAQQSVHKAQREPTVNANSLCTQIFYYKANAFLPQVPLHAFPVRVSGFRLDSQSSMYLGNMQITMLLAEPTS